MRTVSKLQVAQSTAHQEIFKTLDDFFTTDHLDNFIEHLTNSFARTISQEDFVEQNDVPMFRASDLRSEAERHAALITFLVRINRLYLKYQKD